MTLPKIGITLGDPGGIGPEIVLKSLYHQSESLPEAHYVLFGSSLILEREKQNLGLKLDIPPYRNCLPPSPSLSLWEVEISLQSTKIGSASKENGLASFLFFQEAVKAASQGRIQAVVTAPVSKKAWKMAGITYSGHTDFLNHEFPRAIMAFWSDRLKVVLFTHHLPLKKAVEKIKKKPLYDFFILLDKELNKIQQRTFEILVAGLNPHAGEEGLMGIEEKEEIRPAVQKAKEKGVNISGPFPPDVVFRKALHSTSKIVIALYHDQGLIPFKLESFDEGVNLTLGLPFIRTSPDHGTAFDIAGQGVANPQSMIQAINLACELSPLL